MDWEYIHQDGSWVESTAVLDGGVLYIGSSDSMALFAFDPDDGKLLWKFPTGGWSWSMPAVTADTVYIGGVSASPYYVPGVTLVRGLWAVDRESQALRWYLPTEKTTGYLTGGVFATPLVVGDVVYVGSLDGSFYALRR
jgi:outer membrane protein assembly factor BamB